MAIPIIGPAPDPESQAEMIATADEEHLEKFRQHALGMMHSLAKPGTTAPPEYSIWSDFVGRIAAERRKRSESAQQPMTQYSDDNLAVEDQVKHLLDTLEVARKGHDNETLIKGLLDKLKALGMNTEEEARVFLKLVS